MPIGSMETRNKGLVSKGASRSSRRKMEAAAKRNSWSGGLGTGSRTLAKLPGQRGVKATTRKNLI